MKIISTVASVGAALALASPALAEGPPPSPTHAYGKFCQNQSKKHVAGQKGTPFSKCVTGMAKLATEQTRSPSKACKGESKKHVDGVHGTPFSKCVVAGAKLLNDQA